MNQGGFERVTRVTSVIAPACRSLAFPVREHGTRRHTQAGPERIIADQYGHTWTYMLVLGNRIVKTDSSNKATRVPRECLRTDRTKVRGVVWEGVDSRPPVL
jgi:hypothetical protein